MPFALCFDAVAQDGSHSMMAVVAAHVRAPQRANVCASSCSRPPAEETQWQHGHSIHVRRPTVAPTCCILHVVNML